MAPAEMLKNASGEGFRLSVWEPDLGVRCRWGVSSTNLGFALPCFDKLSTSSDPASTANFWTYAVYNGVGKVKISKAGF